MNRSEQNFEIVEDLGIVGRKEDGTVKKFVLIKWYNKPPVYEVREFKPDGTAGRRPGLTPEELENLREIINI